MTIFQENGRANGTTDGLAEATLGSYRTLMEGVIALYELNTKLAVRWIGDPNGIFTSPLETNRRIAEVIVEPSRTQQEALQVLDEETIKASYTDLFHAPVLRASHSRDEVEPGGENPRLPIEDYNGLDEEMRRKLDVSEEYDRDRPALSERFDRNLA